MCLGVPGRVVDVQPSPIGVPMGKVSFGGVVKEVCLAYVPDVEPGEYVVVHVGFAISRIDEEEADEVFRFLESMDELDEIHIPQPGESDPSLPDRFASPGAATAGGASSGPGSGGAEPSTDDTA
ncbi:MAG TPA: HypC/HybG/HupF family hydrogenase formation chaperone [Longimicrobiales bacterium]|nr:HypC/HybG/HupF family hydrogenase formation chaperone [Longimicrobiales bacterium]